MALTYCFESSHVPRTLAMCKRNDLDVVDTEGHEKAVREAVSRGVHVYGYLNVGAVESGRSYYEDFHHIRLAKYSGWDGEYWIDPTAREWQGHVLSLAKQIKATGAIIKIYGRRGNRITHTVGKDADGKIILIPVGEETPINME